MAETWRVVLASGEVREVVVTHMPRTERARECWAVRNTDGDPRYCSSVADALSVAARGLDVREILAPGEPTRAELTEQLAAVTAERDAEAAVRYLAQKDCDTQVDALGHALATLRDSVLAALGAQPHEDAAEVARRVTRERDVLRAQQAPLLDAHDALVAAARAAGWTGAGATGAELVAWVRRGALLDAARIAMERGGEWIARAIVARANEEGGE